MTDQDDRERLALIVKPLIEESYNRREPVDTRRFVDAILAAGFSHSAKANGPTTTTTPPKAEEETEPEVRPVLARDVVPYHWALWCSIEDGKPFANTICAVRWTEDRRHLWFMLDSHNFLKAAPDEVLELIPQESATASIREGCKRDHAALFAAQPTQADAGEGAAGVEG
jgi:hypothetical protein